MKNLEQLIETADHAYWDINEPEISDEAYDELVQQLPTGHRLKNRLHDHVMLSLDKVYTVEGLRAWCEKTARTPDEVYVVECKYDGLSAVVEDNAIWTKKENREDKRPIIAGLVNGSGEIIVRKSKLGVAKRQDGSDFKTCRSAAAGLVTTGDSPGILEFMPFGVNPLGEFTLGEFDQIEFNSIMRDAQAGDVPIDGLVVSLADKEYGESLGASDHHPHSAIAFKVKNPSTTAKVIDVVWQNGKRSITPVAILTPTELDGVTIEKATLHTFGHFVEMHPLIGATVTLERAGSVIPHISGVVTSGPEAALEYPKLCPACGAPTNKDNLHLVCSDKQCGGGAARKLRDAMVRVGIENLGPAACSELVAAGVRDLASLVKLRHEQWQALPGFAQRSGSQAYEHVQDVLGKVLPDYSLVAALNIQGVGISMAKKLCDVYSVDEFATAYWGDIEGVGPSRSHEIKEALSSVEWLDLITTFKCYSTKGSLTAPIIVMTGNGPMPRQELETLAEGRGYRLGKSVTKATTLLICSDVNGNSSKLKKARVYGIKVQSYENWLSIQGVNDDDK